MGSFYKLTCTELFQFTNILRNVNNTCVIRSIFVNEAYDCLYPCQWYFRIFMPRDRRSWGILFLSCLKFCNSVWNLLITFQPWVLKLWYSLWQDLSVGKNSFNLGVSNSSLKSLTLLITYQHLNVWFFIFHMNIPCNKIFLLVLNI